MYSTEIYVIYFGQKDKNNSLQRGNTQQNLGTFFKKILLFTPNADINLNLQTCHHRCGGYINTLEASHSL